MSDFQIKSIDKNTQFSELKYWDVVIIGAGPSGLAASLTTAHRGLTTLIIEAKDSPGGQPQFLYPEKRIIDIPGFQDGITGAELSTSVYTQAKNAYVQFRFNEELVCIDDTDQTEKGDILKTVKTSKNDYLCRKVIISFGLLHYPRKLKVLDMLESNDVYYRIPKINNYEGKTVAVVGGGDSALDAAVIVHERGGKVIQVIREKDPVGKIDTLARIKEGGASIYLESEISEVTVDNNKYDLVLSGNEKVSCDLIIVQIGFLSAKDTFKKLDLRLKDDGSIAVDSYFETSRKGIFAIGDVHGDIKLITVAWAEGIQAAIYAFKEITSPYWLNERRLKDQRITLTGEKIAEAATKINK